MQHWLKLFLIAWLGAISLGASADEQRDFYIPVMGPSQLVFDSNPAYINDHTVFQAADGQWRLIGITHDKVLGGKLPVPWLEEEFAHAMAPSLTGPWKALPRILPVDRKLGETHVWAPHVVSHAGLYYCFYAAGGGHWDSMLNLATSSDLMTWTRHPANPLFRDFYDARDPMVLRVGEGWVMYYTKTYSREERLSTVAYRTSTDLVHWSEPGFALVVRTLPATLANSQYTESPFVIRYRGLYYLFICTSDLNYKATRVFVSSDPLHFEEADEIATLVAHAAEVVPDGERFYLTHAGWFYDGLYLAELSWQPARKFSPGMRFANSGDNEDYLVSAPGAKKVRWGLAGQHALEAGKGQAIEYAFPLPEGVSSITLVFEKAGSCRVRAGDKKVFEEEQAIPDQPSLHSIELTDPDLWPDKEFKVRFESAGPGSKNQLKLSYIKIYYR
ncbi:MAG: hypothetical protein A2V67_02695 [Deltaproteobacteria bacterium RBG_13_61_14]|nr:MAG: hypothetical protein A2V67_02695 [Deltaproteobacteria bacterium RBG_13_61_14]